MIEDNSELRQFIKSSIESKYQVIEANNGELGLKLAKKYIPNIIISDVMMPKMNGFDVCKNVKTTEATAHIPIILLTAKTALDSKIQGLKYGADAYMSKPFNVEELLVRVEKLIENRKKLQKIYSQSIETTDLSSTDSQFGKEKSFAKANVSSLDQEFLGKVNTIIYRHLDNETLSVDTILKEIAMSRGTLHRKLKALINQSISELIRNTRLKEAMQLLQQKKGNVTEITYMVGFSSSKYFATKFKEKYGVPPSKILET